MLLRKSHFQSDWFLSQFKRLTHGVVEAMDWHEQEQTCPDFVVDKFWHWTRLLEYPWALSQTPAHWRCVVDYGSNPQFHAALLGLGYDVLAHQTTQDTERLGVMAAYERGRFSMQDCYASHARRFGLVLGYLRDLPLKPREWDGAYCLSALEHYNTPEEVRGELAGLYDLVMPGGKLLVTIDWFPDYSIGKGMTDMGWNHPYLDLLPAGAVLEADIEELPFHPRFNAALFADADVLIESWPPIGRLAVVCFTLAKPL